MLPSYRPGDVLLWRIAGRRLRSGDVVVVDLPDGRPLGVKRLGAQSEKGWELLSDNASAGTDSRSFGVVDSGAIRGRVIRRLYRRRQVGHR